MAGYRPRARQRPRSSHRSLFRRAAYSVSIVVAVLAFGTVVLHHVEGYSYIDAFYFMSMLATAQGPTVEPATTIGKIFVSIMAFVSVGSVIAALGFLFGPFLGKMALFGVRDLKAKERELSRYIGSRPKR